LKKTMPQPEPTLLPRDCNCLALRQAARAVSNFYDDTLAPSGLRTSQYSLLATLYQNGVVSINELAELLSLDRTTTGKNIRPLERSGFVTVFASKDDARVRNAALTPAGLKALRDARALWVKAQHAFEDRYGKRFAMELRETLREIAAG
jgi:DNA-binding MarR family transcriptional regulator